VRTAVAAIALVLVCGLGFLTVYVMLLEGPGVLTGLSAIVVALLAFGIFGALTE
jgi:hypothetical protein